MSPQTTSVPKSRYYRYTGGLSLRSPKPSMVSPCQRVKTSQTWWSLEWWTPGPGPMALPMSKALGPWDRS